MNNFCSILHLQNRYETFSMSHLCVPLLKYNTRAAVPWLPYNFYSLDWLNLLNEFERGGPQPENNWWDLEVPECITMWALGTILSDSIPLIALIERQRNTTFLPMPLSAERHDPFQAQSSHLYCQMWSIYLGHPSLWKEAIDMTASNEFMTMVLQHSAPLPFSIDIDFALWHTKDLQLCNCNLTIVASSLHRLSKFHLHASASPVSTASPHIPQHALRLYSRATYTLGIHPNMIITHASKAAKRGNMTPFGVSLTYGRHTYA